MPDVTVLTNVEYDHAEHYAGMEALRRCFAAVLTRTRRRVIYCADDPEAVPWAALSSALSVTVFPTARRCAAAICAMTANPSGCG